MLNEKLIKLTQQRLETAKMLIGDEPGSKSFTWEETTQLWDAVDDAIVLLADRAELEAKLSEAVDECNRWADKEFAASEERDRLQAEAERLKKELFDREHASFAEHAAKHFHRDRARAANELLAGAWAERDSLQAENDVLKRAIYHWKPCEMCKNYSIGVFCDDCGGEHFGFDYDKYKDGGGLE